MDVGVRGFIKPGVVVPEVVLLGLFMEHRMLSMWVFMVFSLVLTLFRVALLQWGAVGAGVC